ncbi:MAG: acyl-CoA dehydrogenase family protein [Oscillospiraceae bacterium]|nr:acyl-CoA dehydrogenase family protein [Oscillospiraceae bacterium]
MFKFTEEQLMIRDMVKEFTANEVEPRDRDMDENGFDFDLIPKLVDAGLMAIHLPEEYGGGGGDTVTSEIVINEIAKGSASVALFLDAHWLAADMILHHGTDEQKAKYLPLVAEGKVFAFGLTESNAGSDAAAIKSVAEKQADGSYILNGGKAWITNSGVADYYLIMAKTDPEAGNKGISVFVVPKDAEGLTVGKFEKKMGMRGTGTCELSFDNIKIPAEDRVGAEGRGFMIAMQALDGARVSIGAIASGLMQHAMDKAVKYAKERTTFGKPIYKYQAVGFKFADMAAKIRATDLMIWDTCQMKDEGKRISVEAAELKLLSSRWACEVCDDCIQVHGGNGYSREFDVERFYRDAKLLEIGEGTSEILRMVISGAVIGR